MPFIIGRFEDNGLVVLETDTGESLDVPRNHLPSDAREGDVLTELPEDEQHSEVRYALDHEETTRRRLEVKARWDSLPKGPEGDIEL